MNSFQDVFQPLIYSLWLIPGFFLAFKTEWLYELAVFHSSQKPNPTFLKIGFKFVGWCALIGGLGALIAALYQLRIHFLHG